MKKSASGAALVAAVGFSALTAAPAMAAGPAIALPFENCEIAAAQGVYNIPAGTPGYAEVLDDDLDGIACENANVVYDPIIVDGLVDGTDADAVAELTDGTDADQVAEIPVGAANTGVTVPQAGAGAVDGTDADLVPELVDGTDADAVAELTDGTDADQVAEIPVGAADTGVATDGGNAGLLAAGGAAALALAGGATFLVRRRAAA